MCKVHYGNSGLQFRNLVVAPLSHGHVRQEPDSVGAAIR